MAAFNLLFEKRIINIQPRSALNKNKYQGCLISGFFVVADFILAFITNKLTRIKIRDYKLIRQSVNIALFLFLKCNFSVNRID